MARKTRQEQLYAELMKRYGRSVADAFMAAIGDLVAAGDLQRMINALQSADIEAAVAALHIDGAVFNEMVETIRQAFLETGRETVRLLPKRDPSGAALVIRFDGRNREGERWLAEHSSRLVTQITDDQRQAVRQRLLEGLQAGQNPRAVALDIVGRMRRATGKRAGGILGLTQAQLDAVGRAGAELADPATMKAFLRRERRDRRYDRTIAKAAREGAALPAPVREKILTAYRRRLLQLRGEVIGNVETFNALAEAKDQAHWQAVGQGKISADMVTVRWRHFVNEHQRLDHVAMNGKTIKFGERFVLPDGTQMRFPHDPSAPIKHVAGCHCQADYRVDWLASAV